MADREELAKLAIDCAIQIHRDLGPGLLESVYETLLAALIARSGVSVERQKSVDIAYDGLVFKDAFRIDILVDARLIIEVKSIERCGPVHGKQLLTYLRLSQQPLGLLMNFGAPTLREGLKRIVNNHRDTASSPLRVNQTERTYPSTKPVSGQRRPG